MRHVVMLVFSVILGSVIAGSMALPVHALNLPGSGIPYYVALGDSFSSGEGELSDDFYLSSTNTASNHCHVSSRSYPYLLGGWWGVTTANLACSGSRIHNVIEASRQFTVGGMSMGRPSVMSLSVGGNDVDLIGKLKTCIGIGTCEWAKGKQKEATGYEIKALFPKIASLITSFKVDLAPAALFIVGYPSVINDLPDACGGTSIGFLLNYDERRYITESVRYLNSVLKAAAFYAKVPFIDIETALMGERLCDESASAMNGIRYGDDIAPVAALGDLKVIGAESFHPTPRGHQRVAEHINSQLSPLWPSLACVDCQYSDNLLDLTEYWFEDTLPGAPFVRQIAETFLQFDVANEASKVVVNFLPGIFAPNSIVNFELHSDIKQLGSFKTSSDGSLQQTLQLPKNTSGYHTLHAYGTSQGGDAIDVYQTADINAIEQTGVAVVQPAVSLAAVNISPDHGDQNPLVRGRLSSRTTKQTNNAMLSGSYVSPDHIHQKAIPKKKDTLLFWIILGGASGFLLLAMGVLLARKQKDLPRRGDR